MLWTKQKRQNSLFLFVVSILFGFNIVFSQENQEKQDSTNYILKSEFVIMTDGIKLATDIYIPLETGQYPTILVRSPYNKDHVKKEAEWYTENGYVVVAQDCRGKFLSEGTFYPFKNERADGLETVKWIRSQAWSNGKIAGWGGSYVGYTQWAISDVLDVFFPNMTSADIYGLLYPGGMFSLATAFNWGLAVDAKTVNAIPPQKILASYSILPLSVADDSTFKDNVFVNDWLRHSSYDEYWRFMNHRGISSAPFLSIAGWYDIFLMSQINDFLALAKNGHPDSRIIIGPWCHGSPAVKNEYGSSEKTGHRNKLSKQFLNKHINGDKIDFADIGFKDKKYNLFVMERNEYYGCDVWPPKATTLTNYYIGSDSYLTPDIPKESGQLGYTYDPEDPYPNKGGTFLGPNVGPALQNDNLSRTDQLVFETDVLQSELVLLGPISATLYVSSDAPNTDFIVCLQDVFPNGDIINIQEGGAKVDMQEGINKQDISMWATGYQLNPGHKLRAVITSSWFPRFNRNLNSGEPVFSAKTIRIAKQSIYFGENPSSITLPILNVKDKKSFME